MNVQDDFGSSKKTDVKLQDENVLIDYKNSNFNQHIEKCLSMVLHHDEVQQISKTIKKVYKEFIINKEKRNLEQ